MAELRALPRHIAAGADWIGTEIGWTAVGIIAAATLVALVGASWTT